MKPDIIPAGLTGKLLFDFLVKDEARILFAKKSEIKKADSIYGAPMFVTDKGELTNKAEVVQTQVAAGTIKVRTVINTTNWFDSHGDVHIPGLWKKSLSDNKRNGFYLLKMHQRDFEDVIAESCEGSAKQMSWKDVGIDIPGVTEALVFDGIIEEARNPYMFGQYQKRYVKQHSVGMRYVRIVTCINDDDYPVQKENWDKYIGMVANRKDAETEGYFWAVLEAQVVEGSAVLFGSNCITPTLDVIEYDSTKNAPAYATQEEPQEDRNEDKGMVVCDCGVISSAYSNSIKCPGCGKFISSEHTQAQFDWKAELEKIQFI